MTQLDLKDATLVGFSMGGGEVARYISTYGMERVGKAVFAGDVPPYLYKSADNPDGGLDDATIAGFKADVVADPMATRMQSCHSRSAVRVPKKRSRAAT